MNLLIIPLKNLYGKFLVISYLIGFTVFISSTAFCPFDCKTAFKNEISLKIILPWGESYFVHVNRELCKPLPGIFLLHHTGNMETSFRKTIKTTSNHTKVLNHILPILTLKSWNFKKGMRLNLTQGNHEGRVEKTQVCPVCVVNYSPSKNTRIWVSLSGSSQSESKPWSYLFMSMR